MDIPVIPYGDDAFEFDQTVILTVANGTNYIVAAPSTATIFITDNETLELTNVVARINGPVGIDYHQPSNSLIISINYSNGFGTNFVRLDANGIVSRWSTLANMTNEIKLATAKTTTNGFTNGQVFCGTSLPGVIGRISPDGSVATNYWTALTSTVTNEPFLLRGSLYVDQTGVFSNELIVVTGDPYQHPDPGTTLTPGGNVWRVNASGNATLLAQLGTHLEGVITVPNNPTNYGPLAGKILAGSAGVLFTIDANGNTNLFDFGVYPGIFSEDIDIIPTNQDLYCCDVSDNLILKIPRTVFTNFVGDILVTESERVDIIGSDFNVFSVIHWDGSKFLVRQIDIPTFPGSTNLDGTVLEHVTFAPIDVEP